MYRRRKRSTLVFLFLFSTLSDLQAAPKVQFNALCRDAHAHIYHFRFKSAEKILAGIPADNLAAPLLADYIDFLRAFIDEDATAYNSGRLRAVKRLDAFEKLSDQDPWKRFCLAETKLHWGLAAFKFKEYFTAFTYLRSANADLRENLRRFPQFVLTQKSLGLIEAASGTVPEAYRSVASLAGLSGDLRKGIERVERMAAGAPADPNLIYFHREARLIGLWLRSHLLRDPQGAWNRCQTQPGTGTTIPAERFIRANLAMQAGKNDEAIRILSGPKWNSDAHPFWYLEYLHGLALMRKLDTSADLHFRRYLVFFKGRNFHKSAARNLAWLAWLKNDGPGYDAAMTLTRTLGFSDAEEDKQALRDAWERKRPDAVLLKARLLSDGAYLTPALQTLLTKTEASFTDPEQKTEYCYRMGRILHDLNRKKEAENWYKRTIQLGSTLPRYFAANAALHLGLLCESQQRKEEAKTWFQKAISGFPANTEYANGIEQKARAGLQRIGA
jgi:tetratricopeptide (TPR) repeat protein